MATATPSAPATVVTGGSFLLNEADPASVFTPEDFSEEQQQIASTAAEFAANEVLPAASEIEAKHFDVTRALLKKAGDLGLMAVDIPEEYGGLAMDKVTSAIIADRMSVLASFSVAFSAHVGIGTLPLVWYGTEEPHPQLPTGWAEYQERYPRNRRGGEPDGRRADAHLRWAAPSIDGQPVI